SSPQIYSNSRWQALYLDCHLLAHLTSLHRFYIFSFRLLSIIIRPDTREELINHSRNCTECNCMLFRFVLIELTSLNTYSIPRSTKAPCFGSAPDGAEEQFTSRG